MPQYYLTILLFLPVLGIPVLFFSNREGWIRSVASIITFSVFGMTVPLFFEFVQGDSGPQFVHRIPNFLDLSPGGLDYYVAIDGFSLLLIGMSTILFFLSSLSAVSNVKHRVREFFILLLLVETGVLGVFLSFNLVQFYVFWEWMVLPFALMVGIWGESGRIRASMKYLVFSFTGSVFMLASILVLYHYSSTFDLEELAVLPLSNIPSDLRFWLFIGFSFAFAIKVPLFPFHTWMPDVHEEAPTVGSVDLAGILLKIGLFAYIRVVIPIFPQVFLEYRDFFAGLAVAGIVYGAVVALTQANSKRLVAFSSLSHMGFCILGILTLTEEGVSGGMLQMVNHGFTSGLLFFLLGMLHERTGTNRLTDYSGIAKVAPFLAAFIGLAAFASAGLPGTNGFVGEFLILIGTFKYHILYGVLAGTAIIFAAGYMLIFAKSLLFGEPNHITANLVALNLREKFILTVTAGFILVMGVFPNPFLKFITPSARVVLNSAGEEALKERAFSEKEGSLRQVERKYKDYRSLGTAVSSYEERIPVLKGMGIPGFRRSAKEKEE
ncbi:proton-translocating NADH-quinone oxidoreductase, chain M [Leptospira inadai serovar Lyme str. 10]|uniref:Proton-translocating NADH-quinone oxidoreductase, chain M n=2 Tax=Leptospira inadai serovar Lyme TaxID=293084 RepID=V6HEG7_9LEPT|nr:NADH-quinone oxidoreductase subunit M [Leptospira inadai]EQA38776.1 proton-translocating NADH-quinone oxidoreductase, chain M [Leptospira inadai serovar Lyme str. 10]PNV71758.1 Fe-S-binding domain-containing protein [Leptospira inadai serovar Lyme]